MCIIPAHKTTPHQSAQQLSFTGYFFHIQKKKSINILQQRRIPSHAKRKKTVLQLCFAYRQHRVCVCAFIGGRQKKSKEWWGGKDTMRGEKVSTLDQGEGGNGVLVRAGAEWGWHIKDESKCQREGFTYSESLTDEKRSSFSVLSSKGRGILPPNGTLPKAEMSTTHRVHTDRQDHSVCVCLGVW